MYGQGGNGLDNYMNGGRGGDLGIKVTQVAETIDMRSLEY